MGRTSRKRNKIVRRDFQTCDHSKELISLNSWLVRQGIVRNKKLALASFSETGRGVLTKRKIQPGEELMCLPLNLTINIITLLCDKSFNDIFLLNGQDCLVLYKNKLSFQSVLAMYLIYQTSLEENSKWYVYLKSLPKEYTVPYFLSEDIRSKLDLSILNVVNKQNDVISTSFNIFEAIISKCNSNCEYVMKFIQKFNKAAYEWAYFTVNTRCVYMDLTNVIQLNQIKKSLLDLISDNTKIALCPYLDMINHNPKAKNETKLILNKTPKEINVANLSESLFSDIRFSIYTKNYFDPYTQIFICYGDSYNLKLITEYGFHIPSNNLDYVVFEYEVVEQFLSSKVKLSQEQNAFIRKHNLNNDFYIDKKGLSFNFYAFLMVVMYFHNKNIDLCKLIFSSQRDCSDCNDLIKPIVCDKIVKFKKCIENLEMYGKECTILNNCVELLCQYVRILEEFIKC